MSAPLTELAPAKVNLTLRVIRRRADGYHELESLVAFADVGDRLSLVPGEPDRLTVTGPFAAHCTAGADNLVLKAVDAMRAQVPELLSGRFILEKNLPVAAGIGGGSSDAAAALRLLARWNNMEPTDARLAEIAPTLGADVPVCLAPLTRIMSGVGEVLSAPLSLPPLAALLVNPGVPLATRDVFAALTIPIDDGRRLGTVPAQPADAIGWLRAEGNDLTTAAHRCAPVVAEVLDMLAALPGARLARMSGSGPTCFALFDSPAAANAAAEAVREAQPGWWVAPAMLGAP